eukprot:3766905-Pyramimonas_sp.AAC.1
MEVFLQGSAPVFHNGNWDATKLGSWPPVFNNSNNHYLNTVRSNLLACRSTPPKEGEERTDGRKGHGG